MWILFVLYCIPTYFCSIKNTFNPGGVGTVIVPNDDNDDQSNGCSQPRTATAITIKNNVICLNVRSNRKSVSHGFLAKIFSTLDRFGVVVDLISTSEVCSLNISLID